MALGRHTTSRARGVEYCRESVCTFNLDNYPSVYLSPLLVPLPRERCRMSLQITMTCSAVLASTGRMELSCLGWHWLVMNAVRMRLFLNRLAQPLLWSLRSRSCVTAGAPAVHHLLTQTSLLAAAK